MRMPSCRIEITHIQQQAHGKTEHMQIHMPLHIIIAGICIVMFSAPFLLESVVIIATIAYLVNRQIAFLLYSSPGGNIPAYEEQAFRTYIWSGGSYLQRFLAMTPLGISMISKPDF